MNQIFNAKTVEDAKELAARAFGVPQEEISFEVLEEPKRGFFGFGKKGEAKVKATYIEPEAPAEPEITAEPEATEPEQTVPEVVSFAEETPESPVTVQDFTEEDTQDTFVQSEPETEPEQDTFVQSASEPEPELSTTVENIVENSETPEITQNSSVPQDEELISGEPSPEAVQKIERAKAYLLDILNAMGVKAELQVSAGSTSAMIDIVSPNSGAIIGKRGETLDSLQYLTFMIANRGDKEYYRIILNTADYRERRRKTLEELAGKIAKNVLRSGRSTTLEPMNPYERRIIHSAIAEIEGVNSKSIGEEPYRKVVISSANRPPRNGKRRNQHNGRRDSHKRNQDTPPSRISMDSMKTSFEKDYKRPKPEDDINAGLYGKIEV